MIFHDLKNIQKQNRKKKIKSWTFPRFARVGPPSGLGHRPRAATALYRYAAGPGGIALQRDLQSGLTRKRKTAFNKHRLVLLRPGNEK
jgi:hypothetical protein